MRADFSIKPYSIFGTGPTFLPLQIPIFLIGILLLQTQLVGQYLQFLLSALLAVARRPLHDLIGVFGATSQTAAVLRTPRLVLMQNGANSDELKNILGVTDAGGLRHGG